MRTFIVITIAALLTIGCRAKGFETSDCVDEVAASDRITCHPAGHDDRSYDLVVPPDYDGQPVPLIIALHGGGGNRVGAAKTTCRAGQVDDPSCLYEMAADRGYAVVHPDGTGAKLLPRARTWNAGGGVGEFRCTSGRACEENIDDVAYIEAMLDHVSARMAVDPDRVYSTGLSNGGAMSHRLACELSERIAAIAPVGGGMQLTTSHECAPAEPVPVMHIHGTEDPCWRYEGGIPDCPTGQNDREHVPISRTMAEWAQIKGCDPVPVESSLPDSADDGTTTAVMTYQGCDSELTELRIDGGGHTWPGGDPYLGESTIGVVSMDWGNEILLDFFDRH